MPSKESSLFNALYTVTTVITSSLNPDVVLQKVVEQVAKALDAKGSSLRLLDRSGKTLLPGTTHGLSDDYLRKGPVDLINSRIDSDVLTSNRPLLIEDAATDPRFQYPEKAKEEGIVSILVAPLIADGRPLGILRVYTDKTRKFDRQDEDFLMAVAHVSGIAIDNARLHEELRSNFDLLNKFNYQVFED